LSGRERVMGVFGGFHLGFPGVPEQKTHDTISALREIDVEVLCPMHCTGMPAMMEIRRSLSDRFVMNCTGSTVYFDSAVASIAAGSRGSPAR
jgi:7,8-dihydropterin-6-yl-methyl-4-(beta-D-ribofuranosyl)aminobenzene 5'-phosphate synthase